jgi:hypothetical protein
MNWPASCCWSRFTGHLQFSKAILTILGIKK